MMAKKSASHEWPSRELSKHIFMRECVLRFIVNGTQSDAVNIRVSKIDKKYDL